MLSAVDNFGATTSQTDQLAFLRMAAEDDRFRAELEQNPVEVLGRFGIEIDKNTLPQEITLPSKAGCSNLELSKGSGTFVWNGFVGDGPSGKIDVWNAFPS